MRLPKTQAAIGFTLALLSQTSAVKHNHGHSHHGLDRLESKHSHMHKHLKAHQNERLNDTPVHTGDTYPEVKRSLQGGSGATCSFPSDLGLVAVTPSSGNGGWAMSPDQSCSAGSYCPYACPAGQVSMQWDPSVTSYSYPGCQHGGLYCNSDGTVSKPIKGNPYCADGVGSVSVVNKMSGHHAVCQTVLPGNEAMLIPTSVGSGSTAAIAVPGTNYWASTAAHYYHNPPGITTAAGCIWGDGSSPLGNWSPYVSGANADANGNTYVKIGWNPIYTGESKFSNTLPTWGIKIECPDGGCNGTPCSIDPTVNKVNEVTSSSGATGAGGGNFCVVTVSKGKTAQIVVFEVGSSGGSASSVSTSSSESSTSVQAPVIVQAAAIATSKTSNAAMPEITSTSSTSASSTTSSSPPPPPPTTTSTSSLSSSTTSTSTSISTTESPPSTSTPTSSQTPTPPPPTTTSSTQSPPPLTTSSTSSSSPPQTPEPSSTTTTTSLPGLVFIQGDPRNSTSTSATPPPSPSTLAQNTTILLTSAAQTPSSLSNMASTTPSATRTSAAAGISFSFSRYMFMSSVCFMILMFWGVL